MINRVGLPEPIFLREPFVSVVGGIQPVVLDELIDGSKQDGFSARVLFSYPDQPEDADPWSEVVVDAKDYEMTCYRLWTMESVPGPLRFTDEAKTLFVDWMRGSAKERHKPILDQVWLKAPGHCARFALVLHLVREAQKPRARFGGPVSLWAMEGAIKLMEYFKAHAARAYTDAGDVREKKRVARLLEWIDRRMRMGDERVTARDLLRHSVDGVKDTDQAKARLKDLARLGYGTVTEGPQGSLAFVPHAG
jgi:hypothetical protein